MYAHKYDFHLPIFTKLPTTYEALWSSPVANFYRNCKRNVDNTGKILFAPLSQV